MILIHVYETSPFAYIYTKRFALIREVTLKFAIVSRLFSNSLIFHPYENEINGKKNSSYKQHFRGRKSLNISIQA